MVSRGQTIGADAEKDEIGPSASSSDANPRPSEPVANGHGAPTASVQAERNTIFDSLVKGEGEVSGLIAYSVYKQNKRAWLDDFQKIVGRPPTEAETRAYIIGESTERRLATYRHLAQATLAGQGPEGPRSGGLARRLGWVSVVWAVVLIAAVAVLAYALHSGLATPK